MEQQYRIGEVSRKLGISRDTLRFYEKKGIIKPEKQENGYRYYSYKDLRTLLDIMFFRKYNFSLEEIYDILNNSTYDSIAEKIQMKIEKETKELEKRKRSLRNLAANKEILSSVEHYTGVFERKTFPDFYQLEEDILMIDKQVLELCYIYDEYSIKGIQIQLEGQYMVIPAKEVSGVELEDTVKKGHCIQYGDCVYTVVESDSYSPTPAQLESAVQWAENQGISLSGHVYAGHLIHCTKEGEPVYYIELYLPIL